MTTNNDNADRDLDLSGCDGTVALTDVPQLWWNIEFTYDKEPGCTAISAGDTAREARSNFYGSLAEPAKATVTSTVLIQECSLLDLSSGKAVEDG